MIEHMVRALICHELAALVGPARPYNLQSGGAGQLNRRDADSAARAMHEDALSRRRLRALEKRAIGGGIRNIDGSALSVRYTLWQPVHLRLVTKRLLGVGSAESSPGVDPIADGNFTDPFSDRLDLARGVHAG